MYLKCVCHLLVLLDTEVKNGACDTLQPYCRSGAWIHNPLLMGFCAAILSESRSLGFDVHFTAGNGVLCVFSPVILVLGLLLLSVPAHAWLCSRLSYQP